MRKIVLLLVVGALVIGLAGVALGEDGTLNYYKKSSIGFGLQTNLFDERIVDARGGEGTWKGSFNPNSVTMQMRGWFGGGLGFGAGYGEFNSTTFCYYTTHRAITNYWGAFFLTLPIGANPQLRPYAGVRLGARRRSTDCSSNPLNETVYYQALLGVEYYPTPSFGIFMEIGPEMGRRDYYEWDGEELFLYSYTDYTSTALITGATYYVN